MMDKSLSQSLCGLIPTHPLPLPASLLDLSTSLLAQSRIQARSLKAEEEIARSYACAHLACERLKISLALPKIQPRPPCPPRVYQKLYRYLDSALLTASPRRSSRTNHDIRNKNDAPSTPSRSSPLKPKTPAQQSTRSISGKLKRPSFRGAAAPLEYGKEELVPKWVMPAIRVLCEELGAPAAPPHIYAGVSSILTLQAPVQKVDNPAKNEKEQRQSKVRQAKGPIQGDTKIPALIVAVSLLVYTCLSGKSTPPAEYARRKLLSLNALRGHVPQAAVAPAGAGQETQNKLDDRNNVSEPADVDAWFREIRDRGWTQLDWFKNVGQGAGLGVDEKGPATDNEAEEEEEDSWTVRKGFGDNAEEKEYLQAGLGTMMQDKLDYLSAQRRLTYQAWKRGMIVKIEAMERESERVCEGEMEIDTSE